MDIQFVLILHGALALVGAVACLSASRLIHLAIGLFVFAMADAFLLRDASWQTEVALAFIGPLTVVLAVARTVGAPTSWAGIISIPVLVGATVCVVNGVRLQASGIAWCLATANLYTAVAGLWLLRIGARQVSRLAAVTSGLLTATSAPAIVGWSLLARGHSVRAATVIDCVFLFVIVVSSLAEWTRRCPTYSSPQPQAPSSGQ
jgi:hypothetical protein